MIDSNFQVSHHLYWTVCRTLKWTRAFEGSSSSCSFSWVRTWKRWKRFLEFWKARRKGSSPSSSVGWRNSQKQIRNCRNWPGKNPTHFNIQLWANIQPHWRADWIKARNISYHNCFREASNHKLDAIIITRNLQWKWKTWTRSFN